ncbi:tRNA uridine 5-carboxymethylaminomethyl modification enzyme MnmG [Luteitalea sp. TBR-22]|uniref:tRNA uridine-5-carboxymethylaminomethyl(34) synthesis enzyme MnmG n=1 Tax=Luteitalea sp. TBR-22 TaxID=2802971 RepID=UPI001AF6BFBA|nr:tRNA uridine-5-carboxymethylaminomethyl(34) synthesis enzyme MnmG [Luteitalea sp. TBR-22]BCS36121.1 tRNA uridine 5-carboxymethylaminomethyl modification enzyme MnmG [Luteitalea sp. TBR-22]
MTDAYPSTVDVVVIGAGHAGIEAAWAASRLGASVAVCTLSPATIGQMPCNPAIGGTAKGHLVREIDALGGLMGEAIDATGIQFRLLNRSRGPAVWAPRAQADKRLYAAYMRRRLERADGIELVYAQVASLIVEDGRVLGVRLDDGHEIGAAQVVVTTGTFLDGLIHVGSARRPAGRYDEPAAVSLAASVRALGLPGGRLKTGTPPRVHRASIDFSALTPQPGDAEPVPLSFLTTALAQPQVECHTVRTSERVHRLVREHIAESPLYNGQITGIGPRYCPSLEDKIMRFPDKEAHQLFLEPEGLDVDEVYINGYSMSLPAEVQEAIVRALPGLAEARLIRPGYAVEYDFVQPTALRHTLEVRSVAGLFLAGQINGTSGYEEAAAQGWVAGVNAGLRSQGRPAFTLGRHEAYIGILVDDLVTRGCLEPYRMFTSRAEHRLLLRIDNADLRLTPRGRELGTVGDERWRTFVDRQGRHARNRERLRSTLVRVPSGDRVPAEEALRNPSIRLSGLIAAEPALGLELDPVAPSVDVSSLDADCRYVGYIRRQEREVHRASRYEAQRVPSSFSFESLPGLSRELQVRLTERRPATVGQAGSIPGMTPAAQALISAAIARAGAADGSFVRDTSTGGGAGE